MPLLFARLAGKEALAWLRHRRWLQFHGFPPIPPFPVEIPRWTGDDQERVTGDGQLRTVIARPRLITRWTGDGQDRVTAGGQTREVAFAT